MLENQVVFDLILFGFGSVKIDCLFQSLIFEVNSIFIKEKFISIQFTQYLTWIQGLNVCVMTFIPNF